MSSREPNRQARTANESLALDWKDILIGQAISTVIAIASSSSGKGKFRPALMKVFRKIAENVAAEAEIRALVNLNDTEER